MTSRVPLPLVGALLAGAGCGATLGLLAGIEPALSVGVAFGIAYLLLTLSNLAAGVCAFALICFLEFVLPGGSAISLTKLAGAVLTLAWLARLTTTGRDRVFFTDFPAATAALVAFLAWGTLSALWSESPSGTLLDLSRYLQMMALLVITYSAIRTRTDIRWLLGVFIVGVTLTALYALVAQPSVDPAQERLESTVGDANGVAAFLVAGTVLAIALSMGMRRAPVMRAMAIGATGVFLATFILTGSRSGIVSLAVALIAAVAFAGRWRPQALATSLIAGVVAVGVFAAFAPDPIKERIAQTSPGQVSPQDGRFTLWQVGWRMFEDHPVRGVGLGSFQASSVHYVLEPGSLPRTDQVIDEPLVAHNIFLQVLAEMGVIGGAVFVFALSAPLVCALKAAGNFARRRDLELEVASRALAVVIAAFYASNFFIPGIFNKLLWILLGLSFALLAVSRTDLSVPEAGRA